MQKNAIGNFGGFAQAHARLRRLLFRICSPNSDPKLKDDFIASLEPLIARLGYEWGEFPDAFDNGDWLRDLILTAADASKANGILDDDAQILAVYREEFEESSSFLIARTRAFLSSGSASLKLQRGEVQQLEFMVLAAIQAAFIIGATADVSDSAKHLLRIKQAELARKARAAKPLETALCAAIIAERGNESVSQPAKEAAAILDGVNARLASEGFQPVSVDVIYRRLKKLLQKS